LENPLGDFAVEDKVFGVSLREKSTNRDQDQQTEDFLHVFSAYASNLE
jgi:hypothetical protein